MTTINGDPPATVRTLDYARLQEGHEQDHRGPKSRIDVMKGFKNIFNAQIFCTAFEEIRQFFRMRNKTRSEKRRLFAPRFKDFNQLSVI